MEVATNVIVQASFSFNSFSRISTISGCFKHSIFDGLNMFLTLFLATVSSIPAYNKPGNIDQACAKCHVHSLALAHTG